VVDQLASIDPLEALAVDRFERARDSGHQRLLSDQDLRSLFDANRLALVRERRVAERRAAAVATPDIDTLLAPARAALSAGRYGEAAQIADRVGQARPLDAAPHYLRGLALATAGADAEAVVSLRKALYLDPGDGLAHFVLAGALARLRQGSAAARAYRAAAHALGARPPRESVDELGGRRAEELAALSLRLAAQAEQAS
jgi:Flp pilus assembly protein TadD